MRTLFLIALSIVNCLALDAQPYRKLHFKATVIDTHNDILTTAISKGYSFDTDLTGKTHSDLARWATGGIDVQIFSIWCDGTYGPGTAFAMANRQIDTLYATAQRNPGKISITTTPAQIKANLRAGKLSAMIGVEGGHMIEDNLAYLDSLYKRGARYMTLTWNNSTSWATSAMMETTKKDSLTQKGLTDFGKQVVRRMNELGMIVDISHVGEQTFWDAINTTTKPVIASHSCAHTLCPVFRNLKDDQIKAIAKNGGVIHLNFFSGFVDSNFLKGKADSSAARPPLSMLLDHLDHIVKLAGVNHVGLGSDFDGISSTPQQLDDVTSFPLITGELVKRGYRKKDIKKILGGNFIRAWKANNK